jgi:diacylglycerol kinase family enzyme
MHEVARLHDSSLIADVFIINNPVSGTKDRSREVSEVRDYLERRVQGKFAFCETEGPDHATQLTSDAVGKGYKHIVAMGGDGLFREVGAGAAHSGADVTFLPKGSEEMGRRNFHLSKNLLLAADVLFNGKVQAIDTGVINGERYILNAGIGADAAVVYGVQKPNCGKEGRGTMFFFAQAKNILPKVRGVSAKLIFDGERFITENFFQLWANSGRRLARIPVTKGYIDDGEQEVIIGTAKRPSELVFPAARALITRRNNTHWLLTAASSVIVELGRRRNAQVDGDTLSSSDLWELQTDPQSLLIRVSRRANTIYSLPSVA